MAFSDVLQTLGKFIGLYSDDVPREEPVYNGGYEQPDERYDDRYDPRYDEQSDGYDSRYEEPQDDAGYQSGYGTGGSYVRAGAKPKPAAPRRPIVDTSPVQGLFSRGGKPPQQRQWQQSNNVIRLPEREDYGEPEIPVRQTGGMASTIIFCVRRKDDSSQIINYLLSGINVILNFEEVDDAQCQRVLDMVSGAAFALQGSVERISHRNYLVAPTGVEIVRSEQQGRNQRDGMYATRVQ